MLQYELIETNEGLTVIEIPTGVTAEEAARATRRSCRGSRTVHKLRRCLRSLDGLET